MNKSVRRLVSVLLAVLLVSAVSAGALADGDDTYTIRVYAGNVGTINGGSVWTYTGSYGEAIPFSTGMVELPDDSPYYVRGVRESGLDNNAVSPLGTIREDADYVVAYGIEGQLVAYTVNYVDEAGNALAPSETYYGNAGDKPVVAYLYIDNYTPQAYNLTRTLSDNAGANVFTFVYRAIVRATPAPAAPSPTPVVYGAPETEAGAEGGEEAPAPAGGEEEAPAPEAEAEPEAEPEAAPEAETENIDEEQVPLNDTPQEMIDLDEEDVPLAGSVPVETKPEKEKTELQKEREQNKTNFYVAAGLLCVALVTIVVMAVLLVKKRGAKQ